MRGRTRVIFGTGTFLSERGFSEIDTPEKCIELIKGTFGGFFKDAKFNAKI
ncbi:MAG: hypothetical protein ACLRSW_17020 [Christensenellaceae bacterium]